MTGSVQPNCVCTGAIRDPCAGVAQVDVPYDLGKRAMSARVTDHGSRIRTDLADGLIARVGSFDPCGHP